VGKGKRGSRVVEEDAMPKERENLATRSSAGSKAPRETEKQKEFSRKLKMVSKGKNESP